MGIREVQTGPRSPWQNPYVERLIGTLRRECLDHVVVLNETGRRMLVSNGSSADKIVLNRLGVSQRGAVTPSTVHRANGAPVVFGYLGRLHPTKGLTELMHAVAAISRDVAFRLEIRGPVLDDATQRYVDSLQQVAGGDPRVEFAPAVPAADVPALLAGYDALLCPSMWFENGPTVALEAIAAATPIIGSRVGITTQIGDPLGQMKISGRAKSPSSAAPRPRKARPHQHMMRVSRPAVRGNTALAHAYDLDAQAEPELVDNVVPMGQRRTLLELTEETCRWPIGDPGQADFFFCGGQSLTGLPYCAHHSRVAYQPANSRRDRRPPPFRS